MEDTEKDLNQAQSGETNKGTEGQQIAENNARAEQNRQIILKQYGYVCSEFLKRAEAIQAKYRASKATQNSESSSNSQIDNDDNVK